MCFWEEEGAEGSLEWVCSVRGVREEGCVGLNFCGDEGF